MFKKRPTDWLSEVGRIGFGDVCSNSQLVKIAAHPQLRADSHSRTKDLERITLAETNDWYINKKYLSFFFRSVC